MAEQFKTQRQWVEAKRNEFLAEYPDEVEFLNDWLGMNADPIQYQRYCAAQIEAGNVPPLSVCDTWSPEQFYSIKKNFAPRGSLDWYIPREHRTNKEKYQ